MDGRPITLEEHDAKSEARAESIKKLVREQHEDAKHWHYGGGMSEGINTDKVIVNAGGDGGGRSGLDAAAMIAALGNRNEGSDNAALIAALGNRNGGMGWGGDGFGFGGGGGALGLVALLALLGRRGGIGGGDDCCDNDHGRTALIQSIMDNVGDIRAQVPTAALETQNAIQQAIGGLALGTQQGFANTKDSVQAAAAVIGVQNANTKDTVQNAFALLNTNLLEGLCNVKTTVRDDGDKTRALITSQFESNLQRQLAVAENALAEERGSRRVRDVEVSVNQTVSQNQAQAQAQWQAQRFEDERFNRLFSLINIANQNQRTRSDNDTINFGTMAASGNQNNQNTQVR